MMWVLAGSAILCGLLGVAIAICSWKKTDRLYDALVTDEPEFEPREIMLIGPAGPLTVMTDEDIEEKLGRLADLRRECFRLAVDREIAQVEFMLEIPNEEQTCP